MEKFIEISILYDFYGNLLSEKQKGIIDDYYNNDFSLGEIAEKVGISRQGVYDSLKRAEELLLEYDKSLQLMGKYLNNQELLNTALEKLTLYIEKSKGHCNEVLLEVENDLRKALKQL